MRFLIYIVILVLSVMLSLSGCSDNDSAPSSIKPVPGPLPDHGETPLAQAAGDSRSAAGQPVSSSIKPAPGIFPDHGKTPPAQAAGENRSLAGQQTPSWIKPDQSPFLGDGTTPPAQSTPDTQTLATQSTPAPVKPAPAPFPDDGKTAAWRQSAQFPDYAYDNSDLPRQLYNYSFNQGSAGSHHMLVKPVDFYCQTSPAERGKLLEFFKDFVSSYYTADFGDTGTWENNLRGFFDPKIPVTTVNGLSPETFIAQESANIANNQLNTTLSEILTDESLMYLDNNAHYRVRGRITLQAATSNDPRLAAGPYTYDVEIAFKKKLLAGPDDWATKDYVVTAVVKLH